MAKQGESTHTAWNLSGPRCGLRDRFKLTLPPWPSVVEMAPSVCAKAPSTRAFCPQPQARVQQELRSWDECCCSRDGAGDGKFWFRSGPSCLTDTTTAPESLVALGFPFNICYRPWLEDGILSLERGREGLGGGDWKASPHMMTDTRGEH